MNGAEGEGRMATRARAARLASMARSSSRGAGTPASPRLARLLPVMGGGGMAASTPTNGPAHLEACLWPFEREGVGEGEGEGGMVHGATAPEGRGLRGQTWSAWHPLGRHHVYRQP